MFRILKTWILNLFRVFGFMISDFSRYITNLEPRERLKRKHARVDVALKICAKHEYKMDLCDSNVVDISETGLCFKTDILYPVKSKLELEMEFPQDFGAKEETRSFYALSEVKQVKKTEKGMYLTGVEFKKVYPRFKRRLNKFLKMELEKKMRACIIYFSLTGNTHQLAQMISQELKHTNFEVDLVRLEPVDGATTFIGQGMTALRRKRVKIGYDINFDLSMYNMIWFGSPVWAFSPAPALNTYLDKCYGLDEKKVVAFYTYGSGTGKGRAVKIVNKMLEHKRTKSLHSLLIAQRDLKNSQDINNKINELLESILQK